MIEITINNQSQKIAKHTTVDDLLDQINHSKHGIAVAINNKVVSKNDWQNCQLNANDQLLIIKATQGG